MLNAKFLLLIIKSIPLASNNTIPLLFTAIKDFSISNIPSEFNSSKKIETIVFDGCDENLFINFYGIHTSIFVYDMEIMFIDENSKGIYTSSDIYNNVVYEGDLREMSHEEMLKMFF